MDAKPDDDVERPAVGLPRALDLLRTATFTGRDPENLVTAVVDGHGTVERITFAAMVTGRRPQTVAAAVLAAVADAQRAGLDALMTLTAARDLPDGPITGAGPGPIGGVA